MVLSKGGNVHGTPAALHRAGGPRGSAHPKLDGSRLSQDVVTVEQPLGARLLSGTVDEEDSCKQHSRESLYGSGGAASPVGYGKATERKSSAPTATAAGGQNQPAAAHAGRGWRKPPGLYRDSGASDSASSHSARKEHDFSRGGAAHSRPMRKVGTSVPDAIPSHTIVEQKGSEKIVYSSERWQRQSTLTTAAELQADEDGVCSGAGSMAVSGRDGLSFAESAALSTVHGFRTSIGSEVKADCAASLPHTESGTAAIIASMTRSARAMDDVFEKVMLSGGMENGAELLRRSMQSSGVVLAVTPDATPPKTQLVPAAPHTADADCVRASLAQAAGRGAAAASSKPSPFARISAGSVNVPDVLSLCIDTYRPHFVPAPSSYALPDRVPPPLPRMIVEANGSRNRAADAPVGGVTGTQDRGTTQARSRAGHSRGDYDILIRACKRVNMCRQEGQLYVQRAVEFYNMGEYHDAIRVAKKFLEVCCALGDRESEGTICNFIGVCYYIVSSPESLAKALQWHQRHRELTSGSEMGVASLNIGLCFTLLRNPESATHALMKAAVVASRDKLTWLEHLAYGALAIAAVMSDDFETAMAFSDHMATTAVGESADLQAQAYDLRAHLALASGRLEEAVSALRKSVEQSESADYARVARLYSTIGVASLEARHFVASKEAFSAAIEAAIRTKNQSLVAGLRVQQGVAVGRATLDARLQAARDTMIRHA